MAEQTEAKYYLAKGLMLAFVAGLINFEMIKWVLKAVKRSEKNQEFLTATETAGTKNVEWIGWPSG